MVESWLEAEDHRTISSTVGKAKGGVKTGEPPAKRMSPGSHADLPQYRQDRTYQGEREGFNDSKELGRAERDSRTEYDTDSKEGYFAGDLNGRGKRHSICSNYEDDFEDDDIDFGRVDPTARSKNRFK